MILCGAQGICCKPDDCKGVGIAAKCVGECPAGEKEYIKSKGEPDCCNGEVHDVEGKYQVCCKNNSVLCHDTCCSSKENCIDNVCVDNVYTPTSTPNPVDCKPVYGQFIKEYCDSCKDVLKFVSIGQVGVFSGDACVRINRGEDPSCSLDDGKIIGVESYLAEIIVDNKSKGNPFECCRSYAGSEGWDYCCADALCPENK